jgi:glycerol uptake facilitator-like aquaporin
MAYLWAIRVSGGHFNPATTLAVYLKNKSQQTANARYTWSVMLMQVLGAFFGALFIFLTIKDN